MSAQLQKLFAAYSGNLFVTKAIPRRGIMKKNILSPVNIEKLVYTVGSISARLVSGEQFSGASSHAPW
jgi:hypothetical protein